MRIECRLFVVAFMNGTGLQERVYFNSRPGVIDTVDAYYILETGITCNNIF
jgi:hypothetical protein